MTRIFVTSIAQAHRSPYFARACVALFSTFWLIASAAHGANAPSLPAAFVKWAESQSEARDIRVPFRLTRTLATLKEPIIESGIFWRFADGRFRWQLGTPPISILSFDTVSLKSWDKSEDKWTTLDPKDRRSRLWMGFLDGKNLADSQLDKEFSVTVNGESETSTNISLIPKSSAARKHLKQVDITIQAKENRLLILRVLQADDASVQMDFAAPEQPSAEDQSLVQKP